MQRTFVGIVLIAAAGCSQASEDVRVQKAPNRPEPTATAVMPVAMSAAPAAGASSLPIHWTAPATWKQQPAGQMRVAAYQVSDDPNVLLTVIPLGGESGGLLANVNRWEGQLGLPPSNEQALAKVVTRREIDGRPIDVVDLIGPETANPRLRMLAAIMPVEGTTWFFKLAGPESIVGPQKDNFDAFIKSLHFAEGEPADAHAGAEAAPVAPAPAGQATLPEGHPPLPGAGPALPQGHPPLPGANPALPEGHPALPGANPALPPDHPPMPQGMPTAPAAPNGDASEIQFKAPADWVQEQPKPMRVVSFTIPGAAGNAELIVSRLPAGSGTDLDNINRWRRQIELPPIDKEADQPTQTVQFAGAPATLLDLTGPAKRMLVIIAPRGNEVWFFKLTGPADVVGQQRAAFDNFLQSIQLPASQR